MKESALSGPQIISTHERMILALTNLANHTGTMSAPSEKEDDDVIISHAITELVAARETIKRLEKRVEAAQMGLDCLASYLDRQPGSKTFMGFVGIWFSDFIEADKGHES